jgi:CheY-like chemotaxis protein
MEPRGDSSPAVDALAARFRASLPDKLRELALAWERWLAAPESLPAKEAMQLLVHRLAGSAPAYGFSDLGRHAFRVDQRLGEWDAEVAPLRIALEALCREIGGHVEMLLRALGRASRDGGGEARSMRSGDERGAPLYVVLVEDDPQQAEQWREALSAHGLRVRAVLDPQAMIAEMVLECPDILVIDYWLAGITGTEVSRSLLDTPEFASVPRVCLTVDAGPLPRQVAMDAGFAAVLRKTVRPADLADVLRQVVAARHRR